MDIHMKKGKLMDAFFNSTWAIDNLGDTFLDSHHFSKNVYECIIDSKSYDCSCVTSGDPIRDLASSAMGVMKSDEICYSGPYKFSLRGGKMVPVPHGIGYIRERGVIRAGNFEMGEMLTNTGYVEQWTWGRGKSNDHVFITNDEIYFIAPPGNLDIHRRISAKGSIKKWKNNHSVMARGPCWFEEYFVSEDHLNLPVKYVETVGDVTFKITQHLTVQKLGGHPLQVTCIWASKSTCLTSGKWVLLPICPHGDEEFGSEEKECECGNCNSIGEKEDSGEEEEVYIPRVYPTFIKKVKEDVSGRKRRGRKKSKQVSTKCNGVKSISNRNMGRSVDVHGDIFSCLKLKGFEKKRESGHLVFSRTLCDGRVQNFVTSKTPSDRRWELEATKTLKDLDRMI